MMSKKQWFAVLCVFVVYILFGATVFYMVESVEQEKLNQKEAEERHAIEVLLREHYLPTNGHAQEEIFYKICLYCDKPFGEYEHVPLQNEQTNVTWTFYNSILFIMTIVSTIGYGNLTPTTPFTRAFLISYGIIGIPFNGIVILTLGNFYGNTFMKLYKRWKTKKMEHVLHTIGFIGKIILYIIPGFTVFILLPSVIMMIYENWTFDIAIEFAFETLTTIGVGEHVPGTAENGFGQVAFAFYRIFLLAWIIMGLGYLAMIFEFIARGLQSKQMVSLQRKIAGNIRKTNTKVRQELRAILNEYLFMRVKPVYRERRTNIPSVCGRTQSCPDLRTYGFNNTPPKLKQRTVSAHTRPSFGFVRRQSETDLAQIDKSRTFMSESESNDRLLIKVVNALGSYSRRNSGVSLNFEEDDDFPWSINSDPPGESHTEKEAINFDLPIRKGYHEEQETRERDKYGKSRSRTLPPNPKRQSLLLKLKNTFRNPQDKIKPQLDAERQTCRRSFDDITEPDRDLFLEEISLADFLRAFDSNMMPPRKSLGAKTRMRRLPIATALPSKRESYNPLGNLRMSEEKRLSLSSNLISKSDRKAHFSFEL